MIFKFGIKSFKIKSIPYREFFFTEKSDIESAEVHQEYFHLFNIPVFPTQKIYLVRKKDGKLYEAPFKITKILKTTGEIKTPWYSFLLPILLLGVLAYFYVPPLYHDRANQSGVEMLYSRRHKAELERYNKKKEKLIKEINHLKEGDFVRIKAVHRSSKVYFLKINKIKNDTIFYDIIASKEYLPDVAFDLYKLQKEYPALKNKHKYGNIDFTYQILSQKAVPRNALIQSLAKDYNTYSKRKAFGYPFTENTKNFYVSGIYPERGPYLIADGSSRQRNHSRFFIKNIGEPVELIQIINMGSDIKWENTLPQKLPSNYRNPSLVLNTYDFDDSKDTLNVFLILVNKKGKQYNYELIRIPSKYFNFEILHSD